VDELEVAISTQDSHISQKLYSSNSAKVYWWFALIFLFVVGILIYAKKTYFISWDMGQYLVSASDIATNWTFKNGDTTPYNQRPFFIILLAIVHKLTGGSLLAIDLTISAFSALICVALFVLGSRLYNPFVGFAGALLFISSPSLIFWAPRHIDSISPVLLLFSLIILTTDSNKPFIWGAVAGLLCFFALFVKHISLLFVPAPLIFAALKLYSNEWKKAAGYYILLLPFSIGFYLFITSNLDYPSTIKPDSIIDYFRMFLMGITNFFSMQPRTVGEQLILSPLLLLSVLIVPIVSWRTSNRPASFIPLIVFILHLPLMAIMGYYLLRLGQFIFVIAISYIALGSLVWLFSIKITRWLNLKYDMSHAIIFTLCVLLLSGTQLILSPRKTVIKNTLANAILQGKHPTAKMRGTKLASWLKSSSTKRKVYVDFPPARDGIKYANSDIKVDMIPSWCVTQVPGHFVNYSHPTDRKLHGKILLTTNSRTGPVIRQAAFIIFGLDTIVAEMKKMNVQYLIIGWQKSLKRLLEADQRFQLVTKVRDTGKVYTVFRLNDEVSGELPRQSQVFLDKKALNALLWLKENDPQVWDQYRSTIVRMLPVIPNRLAAIFNFHN
jgi:hypothetical protein